MTESIMAMAKTGDKDKAEELHEDDLRVDGDDLDLYRLKDVQLLAELARLGVKDIDLSVTPDPNSPVILDPKERQRLQMVLNSRLSVERIQRQQRRAQSRERLRVYQRVLRKHERIAHRISQTEHQESQQGEQPHGQPGLQADNGGGGGAPEQADAKVETSEPNLMQAEGNKPDAAEGHDLRLATDLNKLLAAGNHGNQASAGGGGGGGESRPGDVLSSLTIDQVNLTLISARDFESFTDQDIVEELAVFGVEGPAFSEDEPIPQHKRDVLRKQLNHLKVKVRQRLGVKVDLSGCVDDDDDNDVEMVEDGATAAAKKEECENGMSMSQLYPQLPA